MQNSLYLWPMESVAEEPVFLEAHMRSLDIRISCCGERAEKKTPGGISGRSTDLPAGEFFRAAADGVCIRWGNLSVFDGKSGENEENSQQMLYEVV